MYVNTNLGALQAQDALTTEQATLHTATEELSTGSTLTSPANNPADDAIAALMQSQAGAMSQASRNVAQGQNLLNTVNGGIQNDIQIVQQMQTLAVQASSSTETAQDRADIQQQFSALLEQIDANAQIAYNGIQPLIGTTMVSYATTIVEGNTWDVEYSGNVSDLVAPALPSMVNGQSITYYVGGTINNTDPQDADFYLVGENASYDTDGPQMEFRQLGSVALSGTITFNTNGSVSPGWDIQVTNANGTSYTGPEITGQFTYHTSSPAQQNTYYINPTLYTAGPSASVVSVATTSSTTSLAVDLQTGSTNILSNRLVLNLPVLTATSLGLASVSLDTLSGAQNAQSVLSTVLTTLTTAQAHIGAQLDQLQTGATNLNTESVNTQASHATIGSASLSQIMQQVTQGQVLEQNSLQMLADSNHLAQSVLKLLAG